MWRLVLVRCRLCWTITAIVFVAILGIEALILIPSYRNYERDRVGEARHAASAAVIAAFRIANDPDIGTSEAERVAERLIGVSGIAGIKLVDADGIEASKIGAPDEIDGFSSKYLKTVPWIQLGRRGAITLTELNSDSGGAAILLIDTPDLQAALERFVLRIAGLIALIASVVTIATMLVLKRFVLSRLIALEHSVSLAAEALENADQYQVETGSSDEIGQLASHTNLLLQSTSAALRALNRREHEIVTLNATLERRVAERTVELEVATRVAQDASRAKSSFLANMSHELRTPLNAIIGFSEIVQGELFGPVGNPRYKEYSSDIIRSGRHLLAVIDDILDLSRIEADRLSLVEAEADLKNIVDDAATFVDMDAGKKGVDIRVRNPEVATRIHCDERRIRQIVLNLLGNAIKFTPKGGQIDVHIIGLEGGDIGVKISDTGIGIAEKDLHLALQPFGQIAPATARSHQGAGLGLPIARRLLELHDGRLELRSQLGRGTIAIAWLPDWRRSEADRQARFGAV